MADARRLRPGIALAVGMGLAYLQVMQRDFKLPRRAAKALLAGLLAVLLLAFGLLAASGPLHESLHHDGAAGASFCTVCLFAQGHVALPDVAPVLAAANLFPICGLLAASAGVPWSFESLLPPGRAPPGLSHNS